MGSFQKFCLRWNNHTSNFVGSLGSLLDSENYSDVTVCCQGQVWHLHKLVLSAASSHFEHLLSSIPIGLTPAIILDGPASADIAALIHFIYHGEVNIDQENLSSLLRTAASLKIKGLADVSSLNDLRAAGSNIGKKDISQDPYENTVGQFPLANGVLSKRVASLLGIGANVSCYETYEDQQLAEDEVDEAEASPLNLSCNRNRRSLSLDLKEEIDVKPPEGIVCERSEESRSYLEMSPLKESRDSSFYPPIKRLRSEFVSNTEAAHVIHAGTQTNGQRYASPSEVIPTASFVLQSSPEGTPMQVPLKEEPFQDGNLPSRAAMATQTVIEIPENGADPTIVVPPMKSSPLGLTAEGSVNQIPILASTSFSLPILNMSLSRNAPFASPQVTYHQSSSIPCGNGIAHPTSTSSASEIPISHSLVSRNQDTVNTSASCSIFCSKSDQKVSEGIEEKIKPSQAIRKRLTSFPKYTDASVGPSELTETTFTHKKFSPCTIPSTPNTVHIVRGVYNPDLLNGSAYKIVSSKISDTYPRDAEVTHAGNPSNSSILLHNVSPSMVKLTPVAVSGYTTKASAFASNSVAYSASPSSLSSLNASDGSLVSIPSSPPTFVSSSTQNMSSPNHGGDIGSTNQSSITKVTTSSDDATSNLLPILKTSADVTETDNLPQDPQMTVASAASVPSDVAGQNSQRVTINMRTFKEEWRKQLLVDYDPRTNMSICMLCFTTFKSYDGPRKNTYVKHAKRFHPVLEDYSDEEREVIISMYEKHHKYDIDMQKEINKSFRAPNGSGCALKRGPKNHEGGVSPQTINGIVSNRAEGEIESPDEGQDLPNIEFKNCQDDIGKDSSEIGYLKGKRKLSVYERCNQEAVTSTSSNSPVKEFSDSKGNNNNNNNNNNNDDVDHLTTLSSQITTRAKSNSVTV